MAKAGKVEVRLRVLSRAAPPIHESRATRFGLQQKKDRNVLLAGSGEGAERAFEITAAAREVDGLARFTGPYVNGSGANQNLYVTWVWADDQSIINRLKVTLGMPWPLVQEAAHTGRPLVADGTAPEWGVLKNWHGLRVGEVWTLSDS